MIESILGYSIGHFFYGRVLVKNDKTIITMRDMKNLKDSINDKEFDEELNKLANESYPCRCSSEGVYCDICIYPKLVEAFKKGYRKAKELLTHNDPDPIPLTEEILENNGICYDEIREGWLKDGIVLYKYNDKNIWWLSGYYDIIVIKYVHELQSLLKLAGKNIDLNI